MWLWLVLFTLAVAYFVYYFCFKPYNYWKNRGIVYAIPLPLVGNFGDTVVKKKHVSEINGHLYRKYGNERYVGMYIFMKPALLVRDIDLINKICVDEFEHFSDRVKLFDKEVDTVIGNILVNRTGREWKEMRSALSPTLASTTMKHLFAFISDCAETFTNRFVRENESLLEIQPDEIFTKFDTDVVASTCFGVEGGLSDDFPMLYKGLKSLGAFQKLKLSLIQLCPILAKILHIKVFPSCKTAFLKNLVLENMQKRELKNTIRYDYIHYLMQVKKNTLLVEEDSIKDDYSLDYVEENAAEPAARTSELPLESRTKEWAAAEIASQALMFSNSHVGLDPILTASSFMAYELALNPDVQVKLQEEIDNALQNSPGSKISYEAVLKMKYMDCVVSECLRKWPPVYQMDRLCVKNFFEVDLAIPDDKKIVIEKETAVIIPIMAIHRDPKYFPEPERFNPDRFNEENRRKIVSGSYMPFGRGPRSCIGSKFALLEMKLLFIHLLSKFDLVPTVKTKTLLDLSRFDVARHTILGLKPRKVTSL